MIAKLGQAEPGTRERALYDEFETAKRIAEASSVFARVPNEDYGRFPLTGRGDVNTYALFAELFANLAGPRGRAGVIVPTQIATADTTKEFFESLIAGRRLVSFFNFFEIRQWFVTTDDRNPFGLLTIGPHPRGAQFAFWLTAIGQLDESERRFSLSAEDIARINPNTKTAPVFRSRADAELTAKIYARLPVLIDEAKGTCGKSLGRVVHGYVSHGERQRPVPDGRAVGRSGLRATTAVIGFSPEGMRPRQGALNIAGADRRSLPLAGSVGGRDRGRCVPLYEAKMLHQFDHRWCKSAWNKDPVFGVIGIQSGPPRRRVHSGFRGGCGGQVGDAGSGDDREDPSGVFRPEQTDQDDLPRASGVAKGRAQGDPVAGDRVSL